MLFLSKHFWRNEHYAIRADMEKLAVFLKVDPCFQSIGENAVLVNDDAFQHHVPANFYVGQQYRIFNLAIAIHAHIGK